MSTQLVLDAIEHAIWNRARDGVTDLTGLIHHHDRGAQYISIAYTERLAEAGIDASIGTTGDSYDNALAETINGLYKTELIKPRGPWRTADHVEIATLEWSTGSTTDVSTSTAATSHRQNSRRRTTVINELSKPPRSQTSKSPDTPSGLKVRANADDAVAKVRTEEAQHADLVKPANNALKERLARVEPESYLEVLVPNRGLTKFAKRGSPTVHLPGVQGGPDFKIARVLRAYKLQQCLYHAPWKDAPESWAGALVAETGDVWEFTGQGEGPKRNIYQPLESTRSSFDRISRLGSLTKIVTLLSL